MPQDVPSLVLEEFRQLHEHMREHERAIVASTNLMIGGSTTLLSAIALIYSRTSVGSSELSGVLGSYLFLSPILIVLPMLGFIRGHRQSLMKMGAYINIHIEEQYKDARWGSKLKSYQTVKQGDSLDTVPVFAWILSLISVAMFSWSLSQAASVNPLHFILLPAGVFLVLAWLHYLHSISSHMLTYETAWRSAKEQEESDSPTSKTS